MMVANQGLSGCKCGGVGLGCTCGANAGGLISAPPPVVGGCSACSGLGDASSALNSLVTALSGTLEIAGFAVPVWLLAGAGVFAASMLMSPGRRRR